LPPEVRGVHGSQKAGEGHEGRTKFKGVRVEKKVEKKAPAGGRR
jgi:hypothetical protein